MVSEDGTSPNKRIITSHRGDLCIVFYGDADGSWPDDVDDEMQFYDEDDRILEKWIVIRRRILRDRVHRAWDRP